MTKPCLVMVAGPNGAGKTTLTRLLRRRGIDFGEYINPDDIALTLEGDYAVRVAKRKNLRIAAAMPALRRSGASASRP